MGSGWQKCFSSRLAHSEKAHIESGKTSAHPERNVVLRNRGPTPAHVDALWSVPAPRSSPAAAGLPHGLGVHAPNHQELIAAVLVGRLARGGDGSEVWSRLEPEGW